MDRYKRRSRFKNRLVSTSRFFNETHPFGWISFSVIFASQVILPLAVNGNYYNLGTDSQFLLTLFL